MKQEHIFRVRPFFDTEYEQLMILITHLRIMYQTIDETNTHTKAFSSTNEGKAVVMNLTLSLWKVLVLTRLWKQHCIESCT